MKKPTKRKATEAVEQVEPVATSGTRLRVVRQVEGKEAGEVFCGNIADYRLQIKHGSIEVV